MHIEYEISEKDFRDGQRLAIKRSASLGIRMTLFVLPLFGLFLLVSVVTVGLRQGASVGMVPGLVFSLWFLSIPLLSRRTQNKTYAKSSSLHGKQSLDVDENGMRFVGSTFSSEIRYEHFSRFLEDDNVFVLYQKGEKIFNILPKRSLTSEQIVEYRKLAEGHLANKT